MGALHGSVNTAGMPDVMCSLETFVTCSLETFVTGIGAVAEVSFFVIAPQISKEAMTWISGTHSPVSFPISGT